MSPADTPAVPTPTVRVYPEAAERVRAAVRHGIRTGLLKELPEDEWLDALRDRFPESFGPPAPGDRVVAG